MHAKPGIAHLWSLEDGPGAWSGSREFVLRTQKVSASTSSFYPITGIEYVEERDLLLLSLFDGTLHVIHNVSLEPTMVPEENELTSEKMSSLARATFTQTEGGAVTKADMNRISGIVSYDGLSALGWVHE